MIFVYTPAKQEFLKLGDLLNVELKEVVENDTHVFERLCPPLYTPRHAKLLRAGVQSK